MKFIQSRSFVYRNFNLLLFSFVIKIPRDVNKAVEEVSTKPMLGFINDLVDVEIADRDPINNSVMITNFCLLYKFF